jgi:hypothetical protein
VTGGIAIYTLGICNEHILEQVVHLASPRIRNLTGQFSVSKFGLKEARIRPNLCRHKMLTWLSLKNNLYADGWRVVKV